LGKRLYVWRAKGCEVETEDGSGAEAQGLRALAEEEETILVEVPAGRDAALYLVESGDEGNYWVSLKEEAEGGERLVHIEVGLDGDAQGLSAHTEVSFFLPNDEVTQGIAKQVQELLEGSEAEGAGLRAMGAEGELDWSRAEVLLLDGDVEETEALLVVPYVGAEGQSLWGSRRAAIDVERALYVQVKVRREAAEGGRPSYRVSGQAPVVRKGSELERAFKFCPYQYYGRLSSFRRVLCENSWKAWYRKQWDKGRVIEDFLQLYNSLASHEDLWGLVGYQPRHGSRDKVLILGGFRHLTREQLEELWEKAADMPPFLEIGTVQGYQPRDLEGAIALLSSLNSEQIEQWLIQLAEAVKAGNFSASYQQLLQYPDFLKFQEAILLALPKLSPEEHVQRVLEVLARAVAKSSVREMAARISHEPGLMAYLLTVIYPILEIVKDRIIEIRKACIDSGECDPDITPEDFAADMINRIEWAAATVATVEELHFPGFATGGWDPLFRIPRWDIAFVNAISYIIFDIHSLWKNEDYYTPRHAMDLLWGLFMTVNWIGSIDIRKAREAVMTILGVATFLKYGKRWDPIGTGFPGGYWLMSIRPGQATFWGLIPMKDGHRRGMYVELRWNDCINCWREMDLIMDQLLELVAKLEKAGGIIGYMFLNPAAQPYDILLQSAYEFEKRNVALIIIWWEGDQMMFTCIGLLCNQMSANQRRAMACMQAGLGPFCDAEEVTIGSGSPSQDSSEGIGLGPAPPPPPPCPTCPPKLY